MLRYVVGIKGAFETWRFEPRSTCLRQAPTFEGRIKMVALRMSGGVSKYQGEAHQGTLCCTREDGSWSSMCILGSELINTS